MFGWLRTCCLNFHEFLATSQHNLSHLLEPLLQFTQGLFGITIRSVLDVGGFLATALNQ